MRIFIVQVAAVSWATAEIPEITAVIQSFLKAGFRSAAQVEFVAIIGDEDRHSLERRHGSWVSGILFVTHFLCAIVGEKTQALVKRTALLREEVDRRLNKSLRNSVSKQASISYFR